ncbi:MAG: cupredoxin domain-containing protein [Thermodesulfobacteriota bacterium]
MRPFAFTLLFSAVLFSSYAYGAGPEQTAGPAQNIQRFEIVVDSYSFKPDHITVTAGKPVEIMLRSVASIVSHDFSIDDPASGLDVHKIFHRARTSRSFTPGKPERSCSIATRRVYSALISKKG